MRGHHEEPAAPPVCSMKQPKLTMGSEVCSDWRGTPVLVVCMRRVSADGEADGPFTPSKIGHAVLRLLRTGSLTKTDNDIDGDDLILGRPDVSSQD